MVLKSRVPAPDWSAGGDPEQEAKCRKHPLPTNHDVSLDPWFSDEEEASHICRGTYDRHECPFLFECLHISLVNNDLFGMFGGLMPLQRRWVRRNVPRDIWDKPWIWWHAVPTMEELEPEEEEDDEE